MQKTLIFDLGGVLAHLDWDKVCLPFSGLSPHDSARVITAVTNGPIVIDSMKGLLSPRQFHMDMCQDLCMELDYDRFVEIWNSMLTPNTDIVPLVNELTTKHRAVLGSNTNELHFSYCLEQIPALQMIDRYFVSYEVGLVKPDPAFFQHILQNIGAAPADCVFIDDMPENVESAEAVGIVALQFRGIENLRTELAKLL